MTTENRPFKKGDELTCVRDAGAWIALTHGATYTATSDQTPGAHVTVRSDNGTLDSFLANRFILATMSEEPELIDRYDERMLPLFTTLAAAADDRGYCAEYDRLAKLVGAPSRSEIKKLNNSALRAFEALNLGDLFTASTTGRTYVKLTDGRYATVGKDFSYSYTITDGSGDWTLTKVDRIVPV